METLGQYLRRERELRNVTLEDIAKHTKYHISRIKALEEDNHDELPSPPYVKGMLRSLCKFLGLDVTEILLRYQDYLNEQETLQPKKYFGLPRTPFYMKKHFLTVSATVFFFVLAISVFVIFHESRKIKPIGEISLPGSPPSREGGAESLAEGEKGHKFWLSPSKPVWLKIQIDSAEPYTLSLAAGQSLELPVKKVIRFFVSESSGLKIMFDQKEMPLSEGGPKTYVFPTDFSGEKEEGGKKKSQVFPKVSP